MSELAQWISSGRTDVNPMVDELFFARHPESRGTALAPGSDLANEWMQIHAVVQRAVDMSPQNKSGATGDFEVTPEVEASTSGVTSKSPVAPLLFCGDMSTARCTTACICIHSLARSLPGAKAVPLLSGCLAKKSSSTIGFTSVRPDEIH